MIRDGTIEGVFSNLLFGGSVKAVGFEDPEEGEVLVLGEDHDHVVVKFVADVG